MQDNRHELTKEHRGAIVDAYLALTGLPDRRHNSDLRLVHEVIDTEFRHITPEKVQKALKILKKAKKKNIMDTFFLTGTASGLVTDYFPLELHDMRSLEEFQNDYPFKVKMVAIVRENHEKYDLSIDTIYELLGMPYTFKKEKINMFLTILKRAYLCAESRDRPLQDVKRPHNLKKAKAHKPNVFSDGQLCGNPKSTCDVEPLLAPMVSTNSLNNSTKIVHSHSGSLHPQSMKERKNNRILGKQWKSIPIEKCVHLLRRLQGLHFIL